MENSISAKAMSDKQTQTSKDKQEKLKEEVKMRQVLIETNGKDFKFLKNEISYLELRSILEILLIQVNKNYAL